MEQKYPMLFSPITINKTVFKNRIIASPNRTRFKNDIDVAYAEARARGGAACVTVGESPVNSLYPTRDNCYVHCLDKVCDQAYLSEIALAIKRNGAVPSIQLQHGGSGCRRNQGENAPNPIGPVGYVRHDGVVVDGMDEKMIQGAVRDFANAAKVAKTCGFEAVQIHCGHGWLINQFLSARTNTRTDGYGGSLENRTRFPLMVIDAVRKAVGRDFIIDIRVSGDEYVPGSQPLEEVCRFVKMCEGKVDMVNVSIGVHEDVSTVVRMFPLAGFAAPGCNVYLAEAVKKSCNIPVSCIGGINTPELAEKILAEGKADLIMIGRAIVADTEFPNKARKGRIDEIIPCIRCNNCLNSIGVNHCFECSVNPKMARFEALLRFPEVRNKQKVMVVGGGIAGMEAALTAAERGHDVTLYEKSDALGGVLNVLDNDKLKADITRFKNYLVARTMKEVQVKLGTVVTEEIMAAEQPDAVLVAIGAVPCTPPIKGIDGQNVMTVIDAYSQQDKVGQNVVIIGGGPVGAEAGVWYADLGKKVTVLEMLDHIGDPGDFRQFAAINDTYRDNPSLKAIVCCNTQEITGQGVRYFDRYGVEQFIPCDTVLYSTGMRARTAQVEELRALATKVNGIVDFWVIGDSDRPRRIAQATQGGYFAAMNIVG